jgi:hypothetical protein
MLLKGISFLPLEALDELSGGSSVAIAKLKLEEQLLKLVRN